MRAQCPRNPKHNLFRTPYDVSLLTNFDLKYRADLDRLKCAICGLEVLIFHDSL